MTSEYEGVVWFINGSPTRVAVSAINGRAAGSLSPDFGAYTGFHMVSTYNFGNAWSVENGGVTLTKGTASVSFGGATLTRPYIDASGNSGSFLVRAPGQATGTLSAHSSNRVSVNDLNALYKIRDDAGGTVNLIGGVTVLHMFEDFNVNQATTIPATATVYGIADQFNTENTFVGGQLGVRAVLREGKRFTLDGRFEIGLGNMRQVLNANGSTVIRSASGRSQVGFGLLTTPYNSGAYVRDVFTVMPQLALKVGYDASPDVRVSFGGSALYAGDVLRASSQIDNRVAPFLQPALGGTAPAGPLGRRAALQVSSLLLYGLVFGLETRF